MSRSHEAGALHAGAGHRSPEWLRSPENPNALVTSLWPHNVTKGANGVLTVAGVEVTKLAEEFGTPAYFLDEDDFRGRCRAWRAAFDGWDVFYAGKAFLCRAVVRWLARGGSAASTSAPAASWPWRCAPGCPPERIAFHGNNKSEAELARAVDAGVARIVARLLPGDRPPRQARGRAEACGQPVLSA